MYSIHPNDFNSSSVGEQPQYPIKSLYPTLEIDYSINNSNLYQTELISSISNQNIYGTNYTETDSKVGSGLRQSPGVEIPASGSYVSNMDPLAGTQPRKLSRNPGPTFESVSVYFNNSSDER
jgi:hypothetical protein